MDDFAIIIFLVFVAAVTTSLVPAVAGLSRSDDTKSKKVTLALCFAFVQALMAALGFVIGGLFMHLMLQFVNYVVGGLFLFVAAKMIYDSIQVLKAKRLYTAMDFKDVILIAVMSSLNTFMASLATPLVNPIGKWMFLAFLVAAFVWAYIFVNMKYSPKMLKTTAFFQFSGGVFVAVVAFIYMIGNLIVK